MIQGDKQAQNSIDKSTFLLIVDSALAVMITKRIMPRQRSAIMLSSLSLRTSKANLIIL